MRAEVADARFAIEEQELAITASLGVAGRTPDTNSPASLVELADQALLVAKQSGRDRVVSYRSLFQHGQAESPLDNRTRLFGGIPASSVMTTIVAGLRRDETLHQATRYFLRFRIGSAPVIDDAGQLVGILSDKDCLAMMVKPGWGDMLIRDVMKHNVVCYDEDTPVQTVYDFLCRVSIRTVVIVSERRPIGVITRGSLLRWASNVLRAEQAAEPRSGAGQARQGDATGCDSPHERIVRTAQAMIEEGRRLQEQMQRLEEDHIPSVIGGASRMQELVNDLLVCSRYANDTRSDDDTGYETDTLLGAHAAMAQAAAVLALPPSGRANAL